MPNDSPRNKAIRLDACFWALNTAGQTDKIRSQLTSRQAYDTLNTLLREELNAQNNRAAINTLNKLLASINKESLR